MSKERRSYPRYLIDFQVKVTLPADASGDKPQSFVAEASNLSRTSVQFSCTGELVTALLRQQQLPYICDLEFSLPVKDKKFNVPAQLVTHRRVSQLQYVLVLLLRHTDEAQEAVLDKLLHQQQNVGLD